MRLPLHESSAKTLTSSPFIVWLGSAPTIFLDSGPGARRPPGHARRRQLSHLQLEDNGGGVGVGNFRRRGTQPHHPQMTPVFNLKGRAARILIVGATLTPFTFCVARKVYRYRHNSNLYAKFSLVSGRPYFVFGESTQSSQRRTYDVLFEGWTREGYK